MKNIIEIKILKKDKLGDFVPMTMTETVHSIANSFVNAWLNKEDIDDCKKFNGSEEEAKKLVIRCEAGANNNYCLWERSQ